MRRNHSLRAKKKEYDLIMSGQKTLLIRLGYEPISQIKLGDTLMFSDFSYQQFDVIRVAHYDHFAKMAYMENTEKITPGLSKFEALHIFKDLYETLQAKYGIYVFELTKHTDVDIISAKSLISNNQLSQFAKLVDNAYEAIEFNIMYYPSSFNWYWSKMVPGILSGSREILMYQLNNKTAGVIFLKNENDEKKICTLFVFPTFRGNNIGSILLHESFKFLGTTKPLISIPECNFNIIVEGFIKKYNWNKTQVLSKGCYNNASREIVFNGKIL